MKINDTENLKLPLIILIVGLLTFACQPISPKQDRFTENPPPAKEIAVSITKPPPSDVKFENDSVKSTTNIHYTGQYCNECHGNTPIPGGNTYLKFNGDYKQLCRCHNDTLSPFHHASDITPSPEKKRKMPANFPLTNGKLTCNTCHHIYLQCQKSLFEKISQRGAPYSVRTDFCFYCHDKKKYEKLNPHHQINDAGEIITEICLFCHKQQPDAKHETFKDVKFIGDIETICRRCHLVPVNHPSNALHIGVVPSAKLSKNMDLMIQKFNMILPLDENGKMTCVTCHNPHERGVIPDDLPGAKGEGTKDRLRLPEQLCKQCHRM